MNNNIAIIEQINRLEQCARKPENKWVLEELEKRFGHADCPELFSMTILHNEGGNITDMGDNVRNNTDLLVLLSREMTPDEKEEFDSLNKNDRKKLQSYAREKKSFLARMFTGVDESTGKKKIFFRQPKSKDKKGEEANNINIFVKSIDETVGRNSDKTLLDIIKAKSNILNVEVIQFNSRTRGIARKVKDFLDNFPTPEEAMQNPVTLEKLKGFAESLQTNLSRYLYLTNSNTNKGWHYTIEYAPEEVSEANGEATFVLSVTDGKSTIELATFRKTSNSEEVAANIISNLVSENGVWRIIEDRPLARWQVDYDDVDAMHKGNNNALLNISQLIDDGVFELPTARLSYKNETSELQVPSMGREGESVPRHPAETNQNDVSSMIPTGQNAVVGDEEKSEMDLGDTGESIVNIVSTMSKDITFVRSVLNIRANVSINYGFIGNQRLRDQLVIDNLRMENAALNLQEKDINRFYAFCVNAFYQVENIINYYFHVTYPNIDDLLSALEEATKNDGENGKFQFKRSQNNTEKNVGDVQIFYKINAFCNLLFPEEIGIKLTLGNLRQVRNEGEHRCQVLYSQRDEKNKLFVFLDKATFNSVRSTLIKVVSAIKEQDEKRIALENVVVEVVGTIAKKMPSACFVSYEGGSQQLPEVLCKKVKKLKEGDKVTLRMKKSKIIDIIAE